MAIIWQFTKRNLKIFFRDRMQVFFSMLSVLIIIALYVLFLNKSFSSITIEGVSVDFKWLSDSFITAGMVSVTSITATLGALGAMVDDKTLKISKDFRAAPVPRGYIMAGYVLSALIIGFILSIFTFAVMQFYLIFNGGHVYSFVTIVKLILVTALSVSAGASMTFCLVSLLKSSASFGTASTIVGTLIGFLMGVYMPIGILPETVQTIIKFFPMSYSGMLIRQTLMEAPLAEAFFGAPAESVAYYRELMGIDFVMFGQNVSALAAVLVLVLSVIVFSTLGIMLVRRKDIAS